jgi:NAD(P)-dependent dehydrogenase (short-subunit alcohol dehydrogenase family)
LPHGSQLAFVSSLAHLFPFGRAEAYGASKAAVSYFADSLRADLAPTGIDVCLIEPGFVDTPLTRKNDFPMPFLLSAGEAAIRIADKLERRAWRIRFPQRLVWSLQLLRCLPYGVRQRVAAQFARQGGSDAT